MHSQNTILTPEEETLWEEVLAEVAADPTVRNRPDPTPRRKRELTMGKPKPKKKGSKKNAQRTPNA